MPSSQSLQFFANWYWHPLLLLLLLSQCRTSRCLSPIHPKNNIIRNNSSSNKSTETKQCVTRKEWLKSIIVATTTTTASTIVSSSIVPVSNAAETVGKDPLCNTISCLGVWDGLLADCPHGAIQMKVGSGCASSQDDTPGIFAEPWDYSEAPNKTLDYEEQMRILIPAIELVSSRRGDQAIIVKQSGRYVRFLFIDGKTNEESTGEFYFTPNDTTVQFRVGSVNRLENNIPVFVNTQSTRNLERCELIRKELRYTKLPVLRNRKRSFFFGESDYDSFGPSLGAAGEDIDAKMNIDDYPTELLQGFPSNGNGINSSRPRSR